MKNMMGLLLASIPALLLFVVVQYTCDASAGFLDWFFNNLPKSQTPGDYPVLNVLGHPLSDFLIQWAPVTALAFSILLFTSQKKKWGYLLILAPLLPALVSVTLFYNAAQMHVAPGDGLFSSGVLIGKKPSYILEQEKLKQESQNAD